MWLSLACFRKVGFGSCFEKFKGIFFFFGFFFVNFFDFGEEPFSEGDEVDSFYKNKFVFFIGGGAFLEEFFCFCIFFGMVIKERKKVNYLLFRL